MFILTDNVLKAKLIPLPGYDVYGNSLRKRRAIGVRPQRSVARTDGDSTALLGLYAKTEAAPVSGSHILWASTGDDTGEIVAYERSGDGYKPVFTSQMARAQRFALKSVVNKFMPKSRTAKCMRWRVPGQSLQLLKSQEFNKAFYSGLQVCASVWGCPVCSAKISERRRVELVGAVATAKAIGWQVMLLTCTVPHGLGDDLNDVLDKMMAAWRKTTTDRSGKAIRSEIRLEGTVRALEVTDGQNGFHPHFHVLLFISSNVTTQTVQNALCALWIAACVKVGLPPPSVARGVRVDDGSYAAIYASKWGLESELTKGHSKKGKQGSMTPWDMLRAYLATKCDRFRERFMLYIEAFKGRRQLYWSNGLKTKLGVVDTSDEDIVYQEEDHATLLSELTDDDWRAVLYTRSESALLDVAESHPEAIVDFLAGVRFMARAMPVRSPVATSKEITK